jgi:hypothetical protein
MSQAIEDAEGCLRYALNAADSVDRGELPDEIADDVDRAVMALLKAKGHCEVELSEVSAE